jgi:hypothetical protein
VGEGRECVIQPGSMIFNHMVEDIMRAVGCEPPRKQ